MLAELKNNVLYPLLREYISNLFFDGDYSIFEIIREIKYYYEIDFTDEEIQQILSEV